MSHIQGVYMKTEKENSLQLIDCYISALNDNNISLINTLLQQEFDPALAFDKLSNI